MNLMQEIEGINFYSTMAGVFPFWHRFVVGLVQFFGLGGKGVDFIDKYAQTFAKSCGKLEIQEDGPVDFVRKLLSARQNDKGVATMELIRNAAGANMVAGSDTTSISLCAVLYNLYKSPATLAKLRKELREAAQTGSISDPITFKEAQSLPYLQAVIKEALRVHPATGFTMPRVVPAGGASIAGRYFPQGVSDIPLLPKSVADIA